MPKTEFNPPIGGYPQDHPHETRAAATRIGLSASRLQKLRMTDSARIAQGLDPEGPVWSVSRTGYIYYFEVDLVSWLRKNIRRVTSGPVPKKASPNLKYKAKLPQQGSAKATNGPLPMDLPPDAA